MNVILKKNKIIPSALVQMIKSWGKEIGFEQVGISDIRLKEADARLKLWLEKKFHGEMTYMKQHGSKRSHPKKLVPGTISVISARMNYLPERREKMAELLDHKKKAYISRYALGRDYHKVLRNRLSILGKRIQNYIGSYGYRVFVDSAPVLEKPLAEKAGIGWIGKHTNLINRNAGSWFFLGELYTDLKLPTDIPEKTHCGSCKKCIDVCPTNAIVEPYILDARRCISYLTIEHKTSIPEELRPLIGNRIFGCDDCQIFCPWNKFAIKTQEKDFSPRHKLNDSNLIDLFQWNKKTWMRNTEGSAIRRIGYNQWLRNIAVGLGNGGSTPNILDTLRKKLNHKSIMVREHVRWAIKQHLKK